MTKVKKLYDTDIANDFASGFLKDSFIYDEMVASNIWINKPSDLISPTKNGDKHDDNDIYAIKTYLAIKYPGLHTTVDNIKTAMKMYSNQYRFNSLQNYLINNSWDGVSRLDSFFSNYCGLNCAVDEIECYKQVAIAFFVQCVNRAMNPGCKADYMLILQGSQGICKSTLVSILGGKYASDTPIDISTKDGLSKLPGKWIIESPELDGWGKKDCEEMKAFLTKQTDEYRNAYGHFNGVVPRTCSFIGSTNEAEFLKDPTGSRRFWVVPVGKINIDKIKIIKDQLWAEAYHLFVQGELPYLTAENEKTMAKINANKMAYDSFMDILKPAIELNKKYTYTQLYKILDIKTPSSNNSPENKRIRNCMQKLGFNFYKSDASNYFKYKTELSIVKDEIINIKEEIISEEEIKAWKENAV